MQFNVVPSTFYFYSKLNNDLTILNFIADGFRIEEVSTNFLTLENACLRSNFPSFNCYIVLLDN